MIRKIPLKFMAYSFGIAKPQIFQKQSEYLKLLKEWGFKTSSLNRLLKNLDEIEDNYKDIEKKRSYIENEIIIEIRKVI